MLPTVRVCLVLVALATCPSAFSPAGAMQVDDTKAATSDVSSLEHAHWSFYNGRYIEAAEQALAIRTARPDDLAAYELRTSALLFQIKRALAAIQESDKRAALARCDLCAEWSGELLSDTSQGQTLARRRLAEDSSDDVALFYLAKLDLNFVWLHLEPLGRKKGWNEYWEARRSLDTLLKRNPEHTRARVARAWIDYIVDTRLPRGTRWLLGGGNRTRALRTMRDAAGADADFFVRAEAAFGLWEMEVRERNMLEAIAVARSLARDFPENRELSAFLATHSLLSRDGS